MGCVKETVNCSQRVCYLHSHEENGLSKIGIFDSAGIWDDRDHTKKTFPVLNDNFMIFFFFFFFFFLGKISPYELNNRIHL